MHGGRADGAVGLRVYLYYSNYLLILSPADSHGTRSVCKHHTSLMIPVATRGEDEHLWVDHADRD